MLSEADFTQLGDSLIKEGNNNVFKSLSLATGLGSWQLSGPSHQAPLEGDDHLCQEELCKYEAR